MRRLACRAHRIDQAPVAVAQIDGVPQRRAFDDLVRQVRSGSVMFDLPTKGR